MSLVGLLELAPKRPADGAAVTTRLVWNARSRANFFGQQWFPALRELPSFESSIGFDGAVHGNGAVPQVGEIRVHLNDDTRSLAGMIWKGAALTLRTASWPRGGSPVDPADGDFAVSWSGLADAARTENGDLVITALDGGQQLIKPVATVKFGSSGDALLDGAGAADQAGKPVPLGYGKIEGVPGLLVDRAYGIYLFLGNPATSCQGFFDGGAALDAGVSRAGLAALRASAPASATVDFCLDAAGCVLARPWTAPQYPFTAALTCGSTQPADIAAAIVAARTTLAFKAGVVAAFNGAQPGPAGIWVNDDRTIAQALDAIFSGLGSWWKVTSAGSIDIRQLGFAAPVRTFAAHELVGVERQGVVMPTWRRQLGFRHNNRVHGDGEIATAILSDALDKLGGIEPGATVGATVGVDLKAPDGTVSPQQALFNRFLSLGFDGTILKLLQANSSGGTVSIAELVMSALNSVGLSQLLPDLRKPIEDTLAISIVSMGTADQLAFNAAIEGAVVLSQLTQTATATAAAIVRTDGVATRVGTLEGQVTVVQASTAGLASSTASLTSTVSAQGTTVSAQGAAIGGLATTAAAQGAAIGTITTNLAAAQTSITANTSSIAGLTTTVSSITSTVSAQGATVSAQGASIGGLATTTAAQGASIGTITTNLAAAQTSITANTSSIGSLTTTVSSISSTVSAQGASIGGLTSGLATANLAIGANTTSIGSLTTAVSSISSTVSANTSGIAGLGSGVAANTGDITALGSGLASANVTLAAHASSLGTLGASYTVRLNVNGRVSGFGLASGAGGTSEFAVLADRLVVIDPSDDTNLAYPFEVSGGVVKIRNALIGTLAAANIAAGVITYDKLVANTLTPGTFAAGATGKKALVYDETGVSFSSTSAWADIHSVSLTPVEGFPVEGFFTVSSYSGSDTRAIFQVVRDDGSVIVGGNGGFREHVDSNGTTLHVDFTDRVDPGRATTWKLQGRKVGTGVTVTCDNRFARAEENPAATYQTYSVTLATGSSGSGPGGGGGGGGSIP